MKGKLSEEHLRAIITNDWTVRPRETWMWEARKVKPNKLFMVYGKNYLNTAKGQYQNVCITTHKLSEAKAFAKRWEERLGVTDIQIMQCKLEWVQVDD
jgi:hypothetical protein